MPRLGLLASSTPAGQLTLGGRPNLSSGRPSRAGLQWSAQTSKRVFRHNTIYQSGKSPEARALGEQFLESKTLSLKFNSRVVEDRLQIVFTFLKTIHV
jgi:hypothetical protein